MRIGSFNILLQYDLVCSICGSHRSDIGFSMPLGVKPSSKDLESEGWRSIKGRNICPLCDTINMLPIQHSRSSSVINFPFSRR